MSRSFSLSIILASSMLNMAFPERAQALSCSAPLSERYVNEYSGSVPDCMKLTMGEYRTTSSPEIVFTSTCERLIMAVPEGCDQGLGVRELRGA